MILDLKVKLSKLNVAALKKIQRQLKKIDMEEEGELELVLYEELMNYLNMRIKKLEKREDEQR